MAKKIFKKILALCYEEDYPELHKELLSLEVEVNKTKDYLRGIEEACNVVPLYTDENFSEEIEILYEDYLDSLDN